MWGGVQGFQVHHGPSPSTWSATQASLDFYEGVITQGWLIINSISSLSPLSGELGVGLRIPSFFSCFIYLFLAATGLSRGRGIWTLPQRRDSVAPLHIASQFPDQGLNPCPVHYKADVNHWTTREVPNPKLLIMTWSFWWLGLPFRSRMRVSSWEQKMFLLSRKCATESETGGQRPNIRTKDAPRTFIT